jgi:hypothetical protein
LIGVWDGQVWVMGKGDMRGTCPEDQRGQDRDIPL